MFDAVKAAHAKTFSQNFLRDARLARDLVLRAEFSADDLVVEIGPGTGVLTDALAATGARIVAVEGDLALARTLARRFADNPRVRIVSGDFLAWELPGEPYAVFANIPFGITNRIVKKLLWAPESPRVAWLFTQAEAARRLMGEAPRQELSALTEPWFAYDVAHTFRRDDFSPVPNVDVVLLRITRRREPLLAVSTRVSYDAFVQYGFRRQKETLKAAYKEVFTHEQWKRLARDLVFAPEVRATDLSPAHWSGLYRFFASAVSPEKKALCSPKHA